MAPRWRQSEASATDSGPNVFFWARLKLTAIYVLIVAIILLGFSAFLYQSVNRNLSEADDNDFAGPDFHQHFVQNTLPQVQNEIILIDLVILAVSAGISYVLAGYTLRPIQSALEAQQKFSENASHELRTPLAVIRNEAEVLLRNPSPTKELVQATLRSNIEEIDRLSHMAEDLLAVARSQNHVSATEPVDVAAVTQKVVGKLRSLAMKKDISLTATADAVLTAQGDVRGLERALINLLQNAIEHTPAKGSITLKAEKEGTRIVVTISDTGVGIDEQDLPHVFERFYKGQEASGSGLGLSIVKEIITQQGGEVSIDSTKGKGTKVTLRLPVV